MERIKSGSCILVDVRPESPDGFHRCYMCGEYPELAGDIGIKVALDSTGYRWGFCKSCVEKMYNTLQGGIK